MPLGATCPRRYLHVERHKRSQGRLWGLILPSFPQPDFGGLIRLTDRQRRNGCSLTCVRTPQNCVREAHARATTLSEGRRARRIDHGWQAQERLLRYERTSADGTRPLRISVSAVIAIIFCGTAS